MSGLMPRGTRQLLLPASPLFIWMSLIAAFMLNLAANIWWLGRASWSPDFLALVLVFWSIHQPQRIGIGVAFLFGLVMDVHATSVLGQHALAYTLLGFIAIALHRRVLWFKTPTQAMQLLPLFAGVHLLQALLRLAFGDASFEWVALLSPTLQSLMWPLASAILLLPQRRSPDPDANRPL
jgi:rod shape-determining protein MreD